MRLSTMEMTTSQRAWKGIGAMWMHQRYQCKQDEDLLAQVLHESPQCG
jgi:hypothetical protein